MRLAEHIAHMEGTKSYNILLGILEGRDHMREKGCSWEAYKDIFVHFSAVLCVDKRTRGGLILCPRCPAACQDTSTIGESEARNGL